MTTKKNTQDTKRCKVDVIGVEFNYVDCNTNCDYRNCKSFDKILKELDGKRYPIETKEEIKDESVTKDIKDTTMENDKVFSLKMLQTDTTDYVIGIVVTAQIKNIPPVIDRKTNQTKKLNINPYEESLAFANVFLYDIKKRILLYEVNRNGCYLNVFGEFVKNIYTLNNENDVNFKKFDINFPVIFKTNEYERMLTLQYLSDLDIKIYKPNELIKTISEDDAINNCFKNVIVEANNTNSETLTIKQSIRKNKQNPKGLQNVFDIVDTIRNLISKGYANNIKKVIVKGYTNDPEDNINSINLIGDTFIEYFAIKSERLQSDLQEDERKIGIETVYKKLVPELNKIRK